jgi:hypothetical protein
MKSSIRHQAGKYFARAEAPEPRDRVSIGTIAKGAANVRVIGMLARYEDDRRSDHP